MLRAHDRCSSTCLLLTPYNEDQSIQSESVFYQLVKGSKGRTSAPSKSNVERFNNLQQTSFNIWLFRLVYHLSVAIEVPLRIESFGATWT